jgi:hypothetical protein
MICRAGLFPTDSIPEVTIMRHSIAARCLSAAFVLLLVCAATHATAQSNAQSTEAQAAGTQAAPRNSLVKGAWALQFKVDSDAILSEFGGSVAIKRHVSAQSAFRVGFDYGLSTLNTDIGDSQQSDRDHAMVGMFVDFLRYTDVESPIHFFWGTGPFGSFYRDTNTIEQETSETESVIQIWSAGISGRVGVEWFATRTLSFHAEYFGTAYYERRTSESTTAYGESSNSSTITDDEWRLSRGPVVFGLSAYF